ncbi:MAG: tRNA (guanosine(46)-N7)-methyltransferase TrmB [Verrucomicrobiaceae bacterium]|nr:tRNA (guanosine(46)-N7)-methyltransferase TrmB [Verrucomicrobiaceae bacterium]
MQLIPPDYFRKLDRGEIFNNNHSPLEIDLGCGDGSFLLALATHYPEKNFLGVERLLGRVRKVSRKSKNASLSNLKVLRLELAYTVEWLLPDDCASRIHLLFPDPWPKKKHHKRRLINKKFCESLARILKSDGEFLFKTDHQEYFEESILTLDNFNMLEKITWNSEQFYPVTDFERLWLREGKEIYSARYKIKK